MKILIVDDEPNIRALLAQRLSQAGFETFLASNTMEFEIQVFCVHPDVIILDIMLGKENGVLFYTESIEPMLQQRIPILFISAYAEDRPATPAKPGRLYALRPKPFEWQELLEDIRCLSGGDG